MKYREGYKYQVAEDTSFHIPLLEGHGFDYMWARLGTDGILHVAQGYAWDGPSGALLDSPPSIWASLPHDTLYQAMREGRLPRSFRKSVDLIFYRHLRQGGMSWFRSKVYYWAVRRFGAKAVLPRSSRPIQVAP